MIRTSYEKGILLKDEGLLDAAWCVFYKALEMGKYDGLDEALEKAILDEIAEIQIEKGHIDAARATYKRMGIPTEIDEESEEELDESMSIEELKAMVDDLEQNEQYYALLARAKELEETLLKVPYHEQNRSLHKIHHHVLETIRRAYIAINEPELAAAYDEKAEDLAFIHGFDRCLEDEVDS